LVAAVRARCGANRVMVGSSLTCQRAWGPSPRYGGAGARIRSCRKTKDPGAFASGSLDPGPDLFSRGPTSRVSSALMGLTAVFGMGTGMTPSLQGPRIQFYRGRARRQRAGDSSYSRFLGSCTARIDDRGPATICPPGSRNMKPTVVISWPSPRATA
jgi:hypothetical protein